MSVVSKPQEELAVPAELDAASYVAGLRAEVAALTGLQPHLTRGEKARIYSVVYFLAESLMERMRVAAPTAARP